MRLTGAQVTRVQETLDRYHANTASRGAHPHMETETLVEDILSIVGEAKCAPGPSDVICTFDTGNGICSATASFIVNRKARCMEHRNAI